MSVFTIFNHGTDFSRSKQAEEVISLLSNSLDNGIEAIIVADKDAPLGYALKEKNPNYLICEGPGANEGEVDGVNHTWPGKDNPITRSQVKDGLIKQIDTLKQCIFKDKEFQDSFYGNTPTPLQITGRAYGKGCNDNVYRAVWMLTHLLFSEGQEIEIVNIVGWSRGGVTCLKIANLLNEVLPQLNVNIFAYDPVPGEDPSKHDADTRTITPNVKSYFAVLALNERHGNFACIGPDLIINNAANDAWIEFLPMPGNHSDVVRPNDETLPTLRHGSKGDIHSSKSYLIGIALGYQFLSHFGTPMTAIDGMISDQTALSFYDNMQEFREYTIEEYTKAYNPLLGMSLIGGKAVDRAVLTAYKNAQATVPQSTDPQTPYSPYVIKGFINVHHWILAKKLGKTDPNIAHGFLSVSEDRINKWNGF